MNITKKRAKRGSEIHNILYIRHLSLDGRVLVASEQVRVASERVPVASRQVPVASRQAATRSESSLRKGFRPVAIAFGAILRFNSPRIRRFS